MRSNWGFSPDIQIMFRPASAYPKLVTPESGSLWLAMRRPLFFAFLLGCAVSITATGRLTLRLVPSGAVTWSWVLLFDIGALFLVCWRWRSEVPLSRTVDLFCAGHGPWLFYAVAFAVTYGSLAPLHSPRILQGWIYGLVPMAAWGSYIDFFFFRTVFGRSPGKTVRMLAFHRLICWTLVGAYFIGRPLWALAVTRLGL